MPDGCEVTVGMQTNGVLLDESALDHLTEAGISIGVSVDGSAEHHDRHRRYRDGRGSHAAVDRALALLTEPRYRGSFAGLLCTVDPGSDPVGCYEALLRYAPPGVDLLLPHANWASPPIRWDGSDPTPYGDWLVAVFDRWYEAPRQETRIRLFEEIMQLLLGGGRVGRRHRAGRFAEVGLLRRVRHRPQCPVGFLRLRPGPSGCRRPADRHGRPLRRVPRVPHPPRVWCGPLCASLPAGCGLPQSVCLLRGSTARHRARAGSASPRPLPTRGRERPVIDVHTIADHELAALAQGLGGPAVVRALWNGQHSKRLLLLKLLVDSWPSERRDRDEAVAAIAAAEDREPFGVRRILVDPMVGAWTAETVRRLRRKAKTT